ncbi:MAG: hypothetical protein LC118_07145 [Dehalococcoidia bacterium]|nr:hypothetical protein [Dehalococcoidia bacterium]
MTARGSLIDTAIELAQHQLAALDAGDLDAYFASQPQYAGICSCIAKLDPRELRAGRRKLELLLACDNRTRATLERLRDDVALRIGSLRQANRVAAAYLPSPGARFATRREA